MAEQQTAWCLGVAESGRRALTEDERRALLARLAQAQKALKIWRLSWLLFWVSAVLLFPVCYDTIAAGAPKRAVAPFLYFVFCSGPAALLMAALEVVTGWSRWLRWTFAALGLGALPLAAGNHTVGLMSTFAIYLMGTFVWVVRLQIFYHLRALLPQLEADLRDGCVAEFEVNLPAGTYPPAALRRAHVSFGGRPVRFALLPSSGVLIEADGRFVDTFLSFGRSWDPLDVTQTVQGGGYRAPMHGASADSSADVRQRHATASELREIAAHRSRLLRRGVGGFLVGAYWSAFGLRFVEMFIEGRMKPGLSPVGWAIATVLGVCIAWRSLGLRSALGRASKNARIISLRKKDAKLGEVREVELLLGTKQAWTIDGEPARWRTVKW